MMSETKEQFVVRIRKEAAKLRASGDEVRAVTMEAVVQDLMELPLVPEGGSSGPIPMLLWCPECGARHVDKGEFKTKMHHTHACQSCGHCWRPAVVHTVGVQFLSGFKDEKDDGVDRLMWMESQVKKIQAQRHRGNHREATKLLAELEAEAAACQKE